MTALLIFAALVPVMITLYVVAQHTRYGHLRISELPGAVLILLAGKSSRARLAGILASRARPQPGSLRTHALERELGIVPPSALEVRMGELGEMMRAGSVSIGGTAPRRHPRWACGYCSMEHSQPERKCAKCDKQWSAHR